MDKTPPALQHKIDYINALDIPARQKAERIATSTIDYWAWYYRWQTWEKHDEKGLQPAKNPPPMPPVMPAKINEATDRAGPPNPRPPPPPMPPKRVINEGVKLSASKAESLKLGLAIYPVAPANVKFKGEQPLGWYLAGCFFCVFLLSASLGAILERAL
jgi:hypothetical protein